MKVYLANHCIVRDYYHLRLNGAEDSAGRLFGAGQKGWHRNRLPILGKKAPRLVVTHVTRALELGSRLGEWGSHYQGPRDQASF
jgi:hypothetical protein